MNTAKKRLISCDLDGTLLNNHKQISNYSIDILKRLQAQGHVIVLNSGRFYHELAPFIDQLQLEGYVVCCNGFLVLDTIHHHDYRFSALSIDDINIILKHVKSYAQACYLHCGDNYYLMLALPYRLLYRLIVLFVRCFGGLFPKRYKFIVPHILEVKLCSKQALPPFECLEKISIFGSPHLLKKLRIEIDHEEERNYRYFKVNGMTMEVVRSDVSKANAVEYIALQEGLTMEDVIAFGDGGNDISLLQVAGTSIAMSNAKPYIKKQAKQCSTYSNQEDGVARYLAETFELEDTLVNA